MDPTFLLAPPGSSPQQTVAFALVSSLVRASHLVEKRPDINEALQTRFAEAEW